MSKKTYLYHFAYNKELSFRKTLHILYHDMTNNDKKIMMVIN